MNSCGMLLVLFGVVFSSLATAQDAENPLHPVARPRQKKSNIVGEEFHREYERRVEHGVKLTEEEIQRRKKDSDRAREILAQRIDELYSHELTGNHILRQWISTVEKFNSQINAYMNGNLLQDARNAARSKSLFEQRNNVHDVINHQRLWELPASNYPHLMESMGATLAEQKQLALDLAVQKWEADKLLFH